jgi:hypothetical protein
MRRRELLFFLGSAMTATRALRAQQKAVPAIGFLNGISPGSYAPFVAAFRQGLSEAGYVEGQNGLDDLSSPRSRRLSSGWLAVASSSASRIIY